jgi:hypothetical protein
VPSTQVQGHEQEHSEGTPLDSQTEHGSDLSTAALDGEPIDKNSYTVDNTTDPMILGESSATDLAIAKPLISVEDAQGKLSSNILKVLSEEFKGSLTQVRYKDERDQIF